MNIVPQWKTTSKMTPGGTLTPPEVFALKKGKAWIGWLDRFKNNFQLLWWLGSLCGLQWQSVNSDRYEEAGGSRRREEKCQYQ